MYRVHVNHSVIGIPGFGDCVSLVLVTVPVTTYVLRQVPGKGCPDHARVAGFRTVPREADPPNLPSTRQASSSPPISKVSSTVGGGNGGWTSAWPVFASVRGLEWSHRVGRWTVPSKAARRPARFHSSGTQHSRHRKHYRAPRHWVRQCVLLVRLALPYADAHVAAARASAHRC